MPELPTELLLLIFKFLPVNNVISCRRVCKRWKAIIETITENDELWKKHCSKDFPTVYRDAKRKTICCEHWFDLYQALALWSRLANAVESRDECCHSSQYADEIKDSYIIHKGVTAVLKRTCVTYYDISTINTGKERETINGNFAKIVEREKLFIGLGEHLRLHVLWKQIKVTDKNHLSLRGIQQIHHKVKHFRVFGRHLYFVTIDNEIFYCNLNDKSVVQVPVNHDETVTTVSLFEGTLHILTAQRTIYKFVNGQFVLLLDLEAVKHNLLHNLWRYEFFENFNWQLLYFWMAHFRLLLPQNPLANISLVKVYGDIFFVGCKNGVLLIYYKPFTNGTLDLLNHNPVKEYSFAEKQNLKGSSRQDIPVLSLQPIISIDVLEIKNGHKVIVGMPKKLIILTYLHSFEVTTLPVMQSPYWYKKFTVESCYNDCQETGDVVL